MSNYEMQLKDRESGLTEEARAALKNLQQVAAITGAITLDAAVEKLGLADWLRARGVKVQ